MAESAPRTPTGLDKPGQKFFRDVVKVYDLDPHELRVLTEAARTVDELDRVRAELNAAPSLIVKGSTGQPAEHPLLASLRNHRTTLDRLIGRLALPDSEGTTLTDGQRRSQVANDGRWSARRAERAREQAADRWSAGHGA